MDGSMDNLKKEKAVLVNKYLLVNLLSLPPSLPSLFPFQSTVVGMALYDPRFNRLRQVRQREGRMEGRREGGIDV